MAIREKDATAEFRKKLQNPLKPINNTEPSPEFEDYLNKLSNGQLYKKEESKVEPETRKSVCPKCHKGNLKRTAQRTFVCGFCGLESNSPAFIMEKKRG